MRETEKTLPAWEIRLREAASRVEDDLQKLVAYVNDEVVPDVRRNGSVALRKAAEELHRLAVHMEASREGKAPAAAPPPPRVEER